MQVCCYIISSSEASLRGSTSASWQENAPIVSILVSEADLGGLTSASRQIDHDYEDEVFAYLKKKESCLKFILRKSWSSLFVERAFEISVDCVFSE